MEIEYILNYPKQKPHKEMQKIRKCQITVIQRDDIKMNTQKY